jgi:error-prone DNA polymerase
MKALAGGAWGWSTEGIGEDAVREVGLDPADPTLRRVLALSAQLIGFPRHLGQHVGGFAITAGPLHELVPIENASMADRTFIEWDKDDIDALGILKVDLLGLGMLTCIRKAFDLLERRYGEKFSLATIPQDDAAVYEMLSRADSIGVFQVESRAQMTMLPRLRPQHFYDLVIEVAIVRPGPIQGDMVHPYLRRRTGSEKVEYPSKELEAVLSKTLGVPLFQEQAMQIAIVGAGFAPDEADQLRRAMATFKKLGTISTFREKFIEGMIGNGYTLDFAARCFQQIEGFGTYGFPESHAASFALLVYVSSWIKRHYPDVFAAAILNAQPMGFYAPAQLVRDAREHGVELRPADVNHSQWDYTLEPIPSRKQANYKASVMAGLDPAIHVPRLRQAGDVDGRVKPGHDERERGLGNRFALRLGLRQIRGMREEDARLLVQHRGAGYASPAELWRQSGLGPAALERLAAADAFQSMGLDRRRALWMVKALGEPPPPLLAAAMREDAPAKLPALREDEHVAEDYATVTMTLRRHPMSFLREDFARQKFVRAKDLETLSVDRRIDIAGLVLIRQRPGTASGVVFMTIEDETGVANLIVWPAVFERFRRAALGSTLIACTGKLQRESGVIHVVAERLRDLSHRLRELRAAGMPVELARADESRHPPPEKPRYPSPRDIRIESRDFR